MRVIFVDDNEDCADIVGVLFKTLGHESRVAYCGHSALTLVQEFHPDVAFLDLLMAPMDGWELAGQLRALEPDIKLVAITGLSMEKFRQAARDVGFDAYLLKPVDTAILVETLNRICRRERAPPMVHYLYA